MDAYEIVISGSEEDGCYRAEMAKPCSRQPELAHAGH